MKKKRPQAPKVGNRAYIDAMMGLRRSNAAGAHKTPKSYSRKPKHFKGWE